MTFYNYSVGNRLEDRNTYFYSEFHGREFLVAWRAARNSALSHLPPPCAPISSAAYTTETTDIQGALRAWYAYVISGNPLGDEFRAFLGRVVRRFEVTKRLHRGYTPEFKPVDLSDYKALSPYVRLAELLEAVYDRTRFLGYLSTMLKLVDTLCSCRETLSPTDAAHLAWLIGREQTHVNGAAERAGLSL